MLDGDNRVSKRVQRAVPAMLQYIVLKYYVCLAGPLQNRPRAIAKTKNNKLKYLATFHHLQASQF